MLHKHATVNRPLTVSVLHALRFDSLSCHDLFFSARYYRNGLYSQTIVRPFLKYSEEITALY